MNVLAEGHAPYLPVDPDGFRAYVRDHKQRALEPRLMSAAEAVSRLVADGDYFVYDCNYFQRGPSTLIREVIRQQKKDLWLCGKFTYVDVGLLVGAGCVSKVDCGFFWPGATIDNAIRDGRVAVYEYSNVVMTLRLQAGAMGLPFLPVRSFSGTDGFEHSGAKLVEDPFTGQPITLVPALNPDVAIIHAQQADQYGNARVFGTGIAHEESALASKSHRVGGGNYRYGGDPARSRANEYPVLLRRCGGARAVWGVAGELRRLLRLRHGGGCRDLRSDRSRCRRRVHREVHYAVCGRRGDV